MITVFTIVALGLLLPYTPLAVPLKFVLPPLYFLFLVPAIVIYLLLVEGGKRLLLRRWLGSSQQ